MRQYKLDTLLYDLNAEDDTPTLIREDRTLLRRCTYMEIKHDQDDKSERN